jgi:phospholipase C
MTQPKTQIDRRRLLALTAASVAFAPAIQRAWAVDADNKTGTITDVQHVVILMQENRSFDHYFGTMNGVRGFGDRFPIPLSGGRTVFRQANPKPKAGEPNVIAPFHLNTVQTFAHMRVEGTPHNWADAQYAWDEGRMGSWPEHKQAHAMGHYVEADIPFQWALANAFTLCDAYHCSFQGGTNTNRLFLWSGANDGDGKLGGPSISNSHDTLPKDGENLPPYLWTTYCERLEQAGVSWKIYEDMADNFGDNPLVGFKPFRDSLKGAGNPALAAKGLSTQHLDALRADVMAKTLPQVSWVISPAKDSEHPGPSSPAQGADYIARVLDALTANPEVWAKTVFLINFDENDGFFDHVPPPAPPSKDDAGKMLGGSTVDTAGEYHLVRNPTDPKSERDDLMGRPYGLGPRVPLYVISPWSRGGWVNSEVADHTSCIRFLEKRFGVMEPNISPWRRAVCGDLTSCFDFKTPNAGLAKLPETASVAARASALPGRTTPPTPVEVKAPEQATGVRRSRPLPYALHADMTESAATPRLIFRNTGSAAAVFHVYDRLRFEGAPRRYTVEPGKDLTGEWSEGAYDLFLLAPNGFHRHFAGAGKTSDPIVTAVAVGRKISLRVSNPAQQPRTIRVDVQAYAPKLKPWTVKLAPGAQANHLWDLSATGGWYDLAIRLDGDDAWRRRFAGRLDTGVATMSDPAMGGPALMTQI